MKLHLPVSLHKALLACFSVVASITQGATVVVSEMTRVSEAAVDNTITIDYANPETTIPHANGALQFTPVTPENKGISLNLNNTGLGDGKTYELFTGVTRLVDAAGNTITLDSWNNAISNYFDTTQPGTGFWADATLQLSTDGTLQLVRHNKSVKPAVTISTRRTGSVDYQYYEGVHFADIEYTPGSYSALGGAIYGFDSIITLSDNGSVVFEGNTASSSDSSSCAYGGAIYGFSSSTITLSDNGSVTFSGNTASSSSYYARGGAIYGDEDVTLSNNESVTFSGNTASASDYDASGGAIYGYYYSTITLSDNGSVTFSGNTASSTDYYAYGGAIYGDRDSTITLSGNGSVTFSGNTASSGGAIYGDYYSTITLSDNGSVTFSGNTASSSGGAICTYGDLSIRNNDSVEFYQNAEVNGNTYRLRSIYADGGSGAEISLSAAAGKSITFRDSIYIGEGSSVKLNEAYEGKAQLGDIIFTGAATVDDLYTVKGNVAGTTEEIRLSRTSEVYTLTELYGGRFRVEEGAIYQGRGITAMEGSAATVRVQNATLSHGGYDLTFNAGTTLELAGNNTIAGNVQMQGSSSLVFDNTHGNGTTDIIGSLGFGHGADVSFVLGKQAYGSNEVLLYVSDAVSGWDAAHLMVQGNSYTADSFIWVDNLLVLNYDESSFNRYFNGSANYNERHEGNVIRLHYESLAFTTETSSSRGGAIYGAGSAVILLSDNGSVTFSGNTASGSYAYGGAIYGDYYSTITLSDNGSVTFSGNTASSSDYPAGGGAICGGTITLSNNGSVTFSGNTASPSDYNAWGGAIDTQGDLSIRNNDSVEFYQNAEVKKGNTYRLRSIYADGGSGAEISLSAAAGKSITFRDSIYIGEGSSVKLNEAYEGKAQHGDIIFTGATTVDDLYTVKGNVAGTTEEIRLSRTSEVYTLTELYGGRLRVEEGAIYQGRGITAMEGSTATVRVQNATLSHSGYDLTFNAGTTLELVGNNTIAGNVQMLGSSSLVFDNTHGNGTTDIIGSLGLGHGADVSFVLGKQAYGSNEVLLYVSDAVSRWDAAHLMVQGNSYTADSFTWVDNLLVLNYDESSFNRYFNGSANYNERHEGNVIRLHYESLAFTTETSSSQGGAIYGADSAVILLSDNGSVTFSGNTASASSDARGGAIYGYYDSTITLSDNGSVTFSGNTASSSYDYALGGAIYGDISTITLSYNESVTFGGNTASSSYDDTYGGAIYGGWSSTITLSDNGNVTFSGNTASGSSEASGGAIYTRGDLSIRNNDSVEFYQNAEVENGTYRLRSIYSGGYGDVSLSAAAGKSITFRDSIYIGEGSSVKLNEAYEGKAQLGDIIFTGATTVDDLYTVKDNVAGTEEEIINSRTTEVYALTELHGGRLRVEEGAVYKGNGITAMEGSVATVRVQNATLSHEGYALTFNAGTTLELAGNNTISGNVQMLEGSTLRFISSAGGELTTHTGSLNVAGAVVVELQRGQKFEQGEMHLEFFQTNDSDRTWNPTSVRVIAPADYGEGVVFAMGDVEWVDNVFGIRCYATDTVHWNNAAGDGLWNNSSANWVSGGYSFAGIQGTHVILGATGQGEITLVGDIAQRSLTVENGCSYELDFATDASLTVRENLVLGSGSVLTVHGDMAAAGVNAQGNLVVDGELNVTNAVTASSIQVGSLLADSLNLTNTENCGSISGDATVAGEVVAAGHLNVGGAMTAASVQTGALEVGSLVLTAGNIVNTVTGNLTAESVSLVAGSSLAVGGVLTTDEVQMSGTALTLTAGSFGASSMNFELDRAALESLGLGYKQTDTIAQVSSALAPGFVATLNGGDEVVRAGAYMYTISTSDSSVQLTADYAFDGMQVWYRGAWVGKSTWTDFYIGGYDAANGVEQLDLNGTTVQGANLFIAYEDGVTSAVVTNGSLQFDYVDLGGGQFEIGTGASVMTDELYGKGETLVLHDDAVLNVTELTLGTLVLNDSAVTVKKATVNAITGTEGTLAIESGGSVTVKSDVTLTGLTNEGSLNLGEKDLTVNALVDVGGNVTAGEVSVQSRGSRMAEFNKLVADKVTVVNSLTAGRYTDDLSVGDGSTIGVLIAEMLEVREGTVTLGRTSGSTEMSLLSLDLQNDATLVLNQQTTLEVTDTLTATENATVQLKQNASVSYDGMNIANRKESALSVNAYALSGETELELNGAHVAATGSEDKVIDYKLVNSTVENAGTGTLRVTHAENTLSGVVASSGNVEVYNVTGSMSLDELRIATGLSVSLLTGGSGTAITPANEANVTVVGLAVFEKGATLNANLTMAAGSELRMEGPLHMGSTLELVSGADSITLSGSMYDAVAGMQLGESMTLFTGVDALVLTFDGVSVTYQPGDIQVGDRVLASDYFGNLPEPGANQQYFITFTTAEVGGGELAFFMAPEPTTSTLSLLALAALAARRRRND